MNTHLNRAALLDFMREKQLEFELVEHPAVFTCEEAAIHMANIAALGTKNLFLTEEKGPRIFLVTVPDSKRVDMNKLRLALGSSRLSFGKPELLKSCLGVDPGSVTILGIINDTERRVELFIDQAVMEAEQIQAHPLENTASVLMTPKVLSGFLSAIGRAGSILQVPHR